VRVLIDYRAALRERSGVGAYTHDVACALLKARAPARTDADAIELTLFSSSWKDRVGPRPDLEGATIVDRRVPVGLLNLAWHRLGWPPAETIAGRAFDVVHSMHPLLTPVRQAAQVITVHDLHFLDHPERAHAEIRRDYPSLVRAHAARADVVIVVSHFTAGEVARRLGVEPGRIAVCSPGAPAWAPRETPPADGYILFFGTLEPRKNVGGLLDAYERLVTSRRDVPRLLLAGRATDEARPWLERIARPPLAGHVTHAGYVDPGRLPALYAGAHLLVQPSFEEGFGMVVLEAMATGVPVVIANRGSLPEVAGDAGLLVEPDDPAGMADAIAHLVDDSSAAARAAARGLVRARAYSWADTATRTLAAYHQAVEARRRRRGAA
jgi:glycosyltransferase involved in cell wall biosynthesis